MGKGLLEIRCFVGNHTLPVENVPILIKSTNGNILYKLVSDKNGVTESVPLETFDIGNAQINGATNPNFAVYDVEIPFFKGYMKELIHHVQIFDGITSILPVQMFPAVSGQTPEENTHEIFIPHEHGVDLYRSPSSQPYEEQLDSDSVNIMEMVLANEVSVPEYITVHLGSPNAVASNVRVRFIDYIKNVASSEIFPTWHESALYANIFAQISFALNRVYTVWYRSRGKDFDMIKSIKNLSGKNH